MKRPLTKSQARKLRRLAVLYAIEEGATAIIQSDAENDDSDWMQTAARRAAQKADTRRRHFDEYLASLTQQ